MEPESLWERIKQGLRDSATTAAEKAEYLGKLGRARLDIAKTRNAIQEAFSELGGLVYNHLEKDGSSVIGEQADVKTQIQAIKNLETELEEREDILQTLKADEGEKEEAGELSP